MVKAPVTSGAPWGLHQKASIKDRKIDDVVSLQMCKVIMRATHRSGP